MQPTLQTGELHGSHDLKTRIRVLRSVSPFQLYNRTSRSSIGTPPTTVFTSTSPRMLLCFRDSIKCRPSPPICPRLPQLRLRPNLNHNYLHQTSKIQHRITPLRAPHQLNQCITPHPRSLPRALHQRSQLTFLRLPPPPTPMPSPQSWTRPPASYARATTTLYV